MEEADGRRRDGGGERGEEGAGSREETNLL